MTRPIYLFTILTLLSAPLRAQQYLLDSMAPAVEGLDHLVRYEENRLHYADSSYNFR
jgi:hypothetical protein